MTQNNLKIAITGGIGSGKSTVASVIAERGFTVVSCDCIYNELLKNQTFIRQLSVEFGNILNGEELDRKKLSKIVFTDSKKLKRLNELTHPLIIENALKQMSGKKIAFCEVPLLFEAGCEKYFDTVIVVLRDKEERIKATAKRDCISENSVRLRINNQIDYDTTDFSKYYVIHNTLDMVDLHKKTDKILTKIFSAFQIK